MFADDVKKRSGGKLGRFAAISGMPLLLIVQAIGLEVEPELARKFASPSARVPHEISGPVRRGESHLAPHIARKVMEQLRWLAERNDDPRAGAPRRPELPALLRDAGAPSARRE